MLRPHHPFTRYAAHPPRSAAPAPPASADPVPLSDAEKERLFQEFDAFRTGRTGSP